MRYQLIKFGNSLKRHIPVLLITLLLGVSAISLSTMVQKPVDYRSKAAVESKEVAYLIYPSQVISKKGETFTISPKLLGPAGRGIASVILSLKFDSGHVNLSEIKEDGLAGLSVLQKNTLDEANRDGTVNIFLGAAVLEQTPSGAVSLPQLKFYINTNDSSIINWEISKLQVVFATGEQAEVKADSNVSVASRIQSTPTPKSAQNTPIGSPSAVLSPIPTITAVIIPSSTPLTKPLNTSPSATLNLTE